MTDRRRFGILVASLLLVACTNTFIDLTPDSGDGGREIVILPPLPCGDGVVDPSEECDDGNRKDGDGCTWSCRLGPGDPVPGPHPTAVPYVVEGAPQTLAAVDHPPDSVGNMALPLATGGSFLAGSWYLRELGDDDPATLSTRFLARDGTLVRPDVVVRLTAGETAFSYTNDVVAETALVVWRSGTGGIWKVSASVAAGLAGPPAMLVHSDAADLPALAGQVEGHVLAWYEGTDTRPCEHNGSGPSRILLRRLTPDGTTDGMPDPVALEEEYGAWTAPDLAPGDDDTVGILWWRSATGGSCTLRFGTADSLLTTIADGGVIGPGRSGRIADAEGAYRLAWRDVAPDDTPQLGFAAFGRDAGLLASPVVHGAPFLPFEFTVGDVEFAAGDHGLVVVVAGFHATTGVRLYFLRTDLLGRAVGAPTEVDPSCTAPSCSFGPYNIVWAGDAFLVVYFVTVDSGLPTETTQMRLVRLVPEI